MPRYDSDLGVFIPLADASTDGLMSAGDKARLDSMAGGQSAQVFGSVDIQRKDGRAPDADIVFFADTCAKAELPQIEGCRRQHILFHNTTRQRVIIAACGKDSIFGYPTGFTLPLNDSVHIVHEPSSTRWRVL